MTAVLLDGKAAAAAWRDELATRARALADRGVVAGLAVVLVGDDPASHVYVRAKEKAAAAVGVKTFDYRRSADISQDELRALIFELNADSRVHGILVQLPLPGHIDATLILDLVDAEKDVDGFHAENIGRLAQARPRFVAATPLGCMRLIRLAGATLAGANAVVVGRSNHVGKPLAMLLTNANATVTLCHSRTKGLAELIASADVVIAALGRAGFIKGAWIKPGATVIDVGITRTESGALAGDVEFEPAKARAGALTPVPGGVGPMTIAALLSNTLDAAT